MASVVTEITVGVNERIPFRMFQMPCCGLFLCWVMPRYPAYCPRCGKPALAELRSGEHTRVVDDNAWIRTNWARPASPAQTSPECAGNQRPE
jgi:hypothetical protein